LRVPTERTVSRKKSAALSSVSLTADKPATR
jgi:hypothetical protein